MKKLLLLLLCVPLIGLGQNRYHIDEVTSPNDTLTYLKHDMSLLNGIVYSEFGDLGMYVYGKEDGLHKRWFENGQLKEESNWKDGKEDGLHKFWYQNGQLKFEGNWKDGKRFGLHKEWYTNGQLKSEVNYKEGELAGYRLWFKNGQLRTEGNGGGFSCYAVGVDCKQWNENGLLVETSKDGLSKCWDDNGYLVGEKKTMDGKCIYLKSYTVSVDDDYYLCLEKKYDFTDGKCNVLWSQWHLNGQLQMEGYWKDVNGTIISTDDGLRDGLHRKWYENGQLSQEYNWEDGKLISKKCWDEEGNERDCE